MHKNYSKFNLLSLLVIMLSVFLLVILFQDSEKTIEFSDSGLEAAIRETIGKEEGQIVQKDVDTLQILDASNREIENLEGIEHLIELREVNLENNFIKSVSPLKDNAKLESLNLRNNEITSLEDINFADIIYLNIRKLNLRHNVKRDEFGEGTRLSDISILRQMVSLRKLSLRDNHIEDLSPLSDLRRLTELDIRENKFETIEPLETLTRLEKLNIRENKTDSLEPIKYLSRLIYLNIHSNDELDFLDPISNLVNLETLIMRNVEIQDNSFLTKLTKLQRFNAIDTGIEKLDSKVIENLRNKNALRGEVRPIRMLHTLEPPILSKESGFYKEGFSLEIENKAKESEVYYTLDGSEPTINSIKYESPIQMGTIDDNSAIVIRAKALKEDNTLSKTVTKTYFVNEEIDERFDLPIFSLVTDPDNLFDKETGIYVNYDERGSEWEKPVYVEYIKENGDLQLSQNAGIRIHGNWSRGLDQKSVRLYAGSEYDDKNQFENVFFENLKDKSNKKLNTLQNIILRNSGNDNGETMFNDGLMQELANPIQTFDTQSYTPSIVFLNGEYYGVLNVRERLDEYYVQNHYDININDVSILENNANLYRGKTKDLYHYNNMLKYINENDMKKDKHIAYIETQMDFNSFIDYFITEIYYGNTDWPQNNIQYWRKSTDDFIENAPYGHDGRWRWMMLDTDHGFYHLGTKWGHLDQQRDEKHNTIKQITSEYGGKEGNDKWPNFLFRNLIKNEEFKKQFLVRFNDIVNGYLNEEAAIKKIDDIVNLLENEIPYQIERWAAIPSKEYWEMAVDKKKLFAKERAYHIRKHIIDEFDLNGTVEIRLSNEGEGGYIRLNRMDIINDLPGNEGNKYWQGTYFKGIPISIKAVAKEDYEFSHWENLDSSESKVELTPQSDLSIRAVFKEK